MISKEALEEKGAYYICAVNSNTGKVSTYHDAFGKAPKKDVLKWLRKDSNMDIFTKLRIGGEILKPANFIDRRTLPKKAKASGLQRILCLFR